MGLVEVPVPLGTAMFNNQMGHAEVKKQERGEANEMLMPPHQE